MTPDELVAAMPFAVALGMRIETADADETVAVLPWSDTNTTLGGLLHGGAVMTLADTAGAVCAFLGLPPGARTATTQSGTHLLRAVSGSDVRATARPVHRGRTQVVVQTDLTDDRGRLVARTTQTQAVIPG
ncbi:aromatic compound degradation protein PaaI [Actinomycetospora sp. NBRC 106375]|uniref:PaaI family thioesterase n=1 Tax=Actinomycetospora sp. NBRC 106375 TaxID=3032207 RepID=UPI0024A560FE|nr:PaaI family thioesterase [Actinomycetospora sp. NBRC 106375]GLZ48016.1 aromatic compound degradation protein PaaI [Actinomycetospora sp. NBRC 106375]